MNNQFYGKDLISIRDLTKNQLMLILERAKEFKAKPVQSLLKGHLMASCFFEPSTRTRLSFEAAMKRLGGDVIGFADSMITSSSKGETLHDAMRVIGNYVDVVVIRHSLEGSALTAAHASSVPVINAGDGANEHPTQTLLDLFSIMECQNRLDQLNIVMAGDLKFGRTTHSLALAYKHFDARLFFVSPESCAMPNEVCEELKRAGVQFSFHHVLDEVIDKADVLYMTRIQQERFVDKKEFEKVANSYHVRLAHLKNVKDNFKILHPLPRVGEIDVDVDQSQYAYYFQQAENGLYIRQALLALTLVENL